MALEDKDIKQISDAIKSGIENSFKDIGDSFNQVAERLKIIARQQERNIPDASLGYRGGSFGRSSFDMTLEEKIRRAERGNALQYKDTKTSTSARRVLNGINEPKRQLEYKKNDVEEAIEHYRNTIDELKKTYNLLGQSDAEILDGAKEKFSELSEEVDKLKDKLEEIKNTDFTEAFDFDENGEVLSANIDKVKELKEHFKDISLTEEDIESIARDQKAGKEDLYAITSKLNGLENKRRDVGEAISNVYDNQTDALREQARYADLAINTMKEGVSQISRGFGKLKNLALDLAEGWRKVDQASANFAKNVGVGSKGLIALRKNTIDMVANKGIGLNYGIGMDELINITQNYSKVTGRNVGMTAEDIETGAAMSRLMGDKGGEFATALENFGLSYTEAGKRAGKMFSDASKAGLSFEKYSENFLKNIKLAQNYTFRDGLKGLERMAKKATEIRLDMQQVASFADKVRTLQGAVETSAQLQVLGGPFAQFSDPLGMLNEGLNDIESLLDRFNRMTGGLSNFNEKTGQVEVSTFNRERLRAAAQAMGMNYDQVMESVQEQGRRNFVEAQLKSGGRKFTDEQREFLMNTATVQNGQAQMSFLDKNGNRVTKNVNELTAGDIEQAKAQNQSDSDNIKSIAKATMSFNEKVEGVKKTIEAIKAKGIEPVMDWLNTKLGKAQEYLNLIKIAVIGIAGATALIGVGKIGGGLINTGRGAVNFLHAGRYFRNTGGLAGNLVSRTRFGRGFNIGAAGRGGLAGNSAGVRFSQTNWGQGIINNKSFGGGNAARGLAKAGGIAAGGILALGEAGIAYHRSKKLDKEYNDIAKEGKIKKGSAEDEELIREKYGKKGANWGRAAGTAVGTALNFIPGVGPILGIALTGIIGEVGASIGQAIGRNSDKKIKKELEERKQEAIVEQGLHNTLRRAGFDLKGGYEKTEYQQIMSVINRGGDNTITKEEFETLPEELRKKMMENGDVSLFPDLEGFAIENASVDAENMTVNAASININGEPYSKKARGGLLNGPSHAQGGMPILGSNIEVEGGEYVVNKHATREHLGLLNAINKMGSGGTVEIKPRTDTSINPVRVLPSTTSTTNSTSTNETHVAPVDVNINGKIELVGGNGKTADLSELMRDPVFIRQITNLIEQQMIFNNRGARYTDKFRS